MKMLLFVLLAASTAVSAQKNSFDYYLRKTNEHTLAFYQAVSTPGAWSDYERDLKDIMVDIDEDLEKGSGFSFEEMNHLREFRLANKTLQEFGDGISPDGYKKAFNGHMLTLIQVLFPEITFELYTSYNDCINIYKLRFRGYVVFTARHNKKGTMEKISWRDGAMSCRYIMGNFNTLGGFYKSFWDNSACPSNATPRIIVTGCEFYSHIDQMYAPVKSFLDD